MKAAFIHETGPADRIQIGDLPMPQPGLRQVLVRVGAVAVNPIDTYLRAGMVPMPLPKPFIIGCDLAGAVVGLGPGATRFQAGDRVWGSNQGLLGRQGTFAEYVAVDEDWLFPTPNAVTDEIAAATALVGITAHIGLVRCARLQAGENLFVNGGTGGVGSTVVQMAKALGARVITTAGTDAKAQAARELGADQALNYHQEGLDAAIKAFAPGGINVWWETLREPNFERTIGLLAPRGRMVVMAGRDARPAFPVGPFYVKGCSLFGFAMFTFTAQEQRPCGEDLNRWMAEGRVRAKIDRVLPLDQAALAHQLQEENTIGKKGSLAGKIVLKP